MTVIIGTAPTTIEIADKATDPGETSHIVFVPEHLRGNITPQALVLQARVEGIIITALCGYEWIPKRDPKPLPVCEKCLDIYRDSDRDDRNELPED